MRRERTKSLLLLVCALMLLGSGLTAQASAQTIEPKYVGISTSHPWVEINALGTILCYDTISLKSGYTADVTWEMQYGRNENWVTGATWTRSGKGTLAFSDTRHAIRGFDYRLKATMYVYNGQGVLVESPIKYSPTVSY